MIAGQAVISHLKENKDTIYPSLMDKGNRLTNEINKFCEENEYPAQILNAGSKFHMKFRGNQLAVVLISRVIMAVSTNKLKMNFIFIYLVTT